MASRLMIPDRPAYEPIRLANAEPRAGTDVREVLDREPRSETSGGMRAGAEAIQMVDATELDADIVEVPVGTWFG